MTAVSAAKNPGRLTPKLVTVQMPTPTITTPTDNFTSRLNVLPFIAYSKQQMVGMTLSFAIFWREEDKKDARGGGLKPLSWSKGETPKRTCHHYFTSVLTDSEKERSFEILPSSFCPYVFLFISNKRVKV